MSELKHIIPIIGDSAANDAYTGYQGELTVDTTTNTLRLHDGVVMGGHTLYTTKSYIPTKLSELVNDTNYILKTDTVYRATIAEQDSKGQVIADTYVDKTGCALKGGAASYTMGSTSLNFVNNTASTYISLANNGYEWKIPTTGAISYNGTITANAVYNAVYNDYAEFFERGEPTEVGDIIALDENAEGEVYVKATLDNHCIVGVHSDSFGHLIGGVNPPDGEDFVQYNLPNYIPVGLCGRVKVKVRGCVQRGDHISVSNERGVGIVGDMNIVGIALQDKKDDDVGLIKVLLKV